MKKLVTILMALALIASLSISAFATENNYTLTITGAADHTYDIYQIYTGDIAQEGDKTVLSNVKYGVNHYPINGAVGDPVPSDELDALVNSTDPTGILDSSVKGTPFKDDVTPADGESTIEITGIPAGYYMIVDVSPDLPDGQTKSPIILQVLESVTIASKHASITSFKQVDDANDSNNNEDGYDWQDAADYDIGDTVPFRLTVTLPSTMPTYETYELTFHDKLDAAFTTPQIQRVYILQADGTEIDIAAATATTSGYTMHEVCPTPTTCEFHGCSFAVKVGDINDLYGDKTFADSDMLIVEYTAALNGTVNVGEAGNENGMYVCHPDGHTPIDYVTVLTYELTVNKIDGATTEELEGAGFTLYKWIADANKGSGDWVEVGVRAAGDGIVKFTWTGIDGGQYKLVETQTPAGYNTLGEIIFVVDATHKTEWIKGGNSAFEDLIAKDLSGTTIVFADRDANGVEDGKLEGNIENYKGAILPETGAEGTFLLVAIGTLLVVVAGVFMITRKKMSIYED